MSCSTQTIWTCDRCGVIEETNIAPLGWFLFSLSRSETKDGGASRRVSQPFDQKHACDDCGIFIRRTMDGELA